MKAHIVIVIAAFVSASSTAGLFDAVKNVANGVAGTGCSCQANLPSGASCGNEPVGDSPYCQRHKCQLCNGLAWADGVCKKCANKGTYGKNRTKEVVHQSNVGGKKRRARKEDVVQVEAFRSPDGKMLFAGYKLGMVAPYKSKGCEECKLDEQFLNVFESVRLEYDKSKLLQRIEFTSTPFNKDDEQKMQSVFDSTCANFESSYGVNLNRKKKFPEYKDDNLRIGLWVQSVNKTINGVAGEYKTIRLTVIASNKTTAPATAKVAGVSREIVPYGEKKYLHSSSGIVYCFRKYDRRQEPGNHDAIRICGLEKDIVTKNGGVVKIPTRLVHGNEVAETGEYSINHFEDLINQIQCCWARDVKDGRLIVDVSDFPASNFQDVQFNDGVFCEKNRGGYEKISKVLLPKEVLLGDRFMKSVEKVVNQKDRKCMLEYFDATKVRGEYLDKMLAADNKEMKYPCDSICGEHPMLYKELSSGVSRAWCRLWLEKYATDYREYDERYDDDWFSQNGLKKNEIKANVGGNELRLVFSETEDVLLSVICTFSDGGVDKNALIEKYKRQFGVAGNLKTSNSGVKMNRQVSTLPRTRKQQRELDRMALSGDAMSLAIVRTTEDLDPFGKVSLESDAKIYYQTFETLLIDGDGVSVKANTATFFGCAFLANNTYNRIADSGRLCDLENVERCSYDAFFDATGNCKVRNENCGDALKTATNSIRQEIEKLKEQDGRVAEIEIIAISLRQKLEARERGVREKAKEEAKANLKKKDAKALDF